MELSVLAGKGFGIGRRRTVTPASSGRYLRSVPATETNRDAPLDVVASLHAALLRTGRNCSAGGLPDCVDLRRKVLQQRDARLIIFLVDASDSMGSGVVARIGAAKGALLGLLKTAYLQRDQVALISFRERGAQLLLQPTASIERARNLLQRLTVGGATPLPAGLREVERLVCRTRLRQPQIRPVVVILSDGEANIPLVPGGAIGKEIDGLAASLRRRSVTSVVVDSRTESTSAPVLKKLADDLGGSYHHIRQLRARGLLRVVRNLTG